MRYLSICAVIRDEAPYIEEWLDFHKLQGVEHFYLYLNDCKDNTLEKIIKKERGVTVRFTRGLKIQLKAYADCIKQYKGITKWLACIDCDEFLYCTRGAPLPNMLKKYETFAGVAVHWVLYGSNGELEYQDIPVIERFTKRANEVNHHVKTIIQPDKIESVGKDPHYFIPIKPFKIVNERNKILTPPYALEENGTAEIFRLNHYHLKSKAEYFKRKKNPDPELGEVRSLEWVEESFRAHDRNEVEDTTALQFLEKLKC